MRSPSNREPERLVFGLANRIASPQGQETPVKKWGDQEVQVAAADYNPSYARRSLVPLMRRSVAVGDVDGDGAPDLYVAVAGRPNLLLHGAPDGTFKASEDSPWAAGPDGGLSAAFSDYDHSGRQSLFVAGTEGITVYRNNDDNRFSEATRQAGIRNVPGVLYASVALGDFDGDGFPDLLAVAYTDLNHPPSKPVFTFPDDFPGVGSHLYRNNGDGTFTDVTESSGLGENPGRARKAILADSNNDQRLDILLLRDNKPPVLYLNRGGWKFEDTTWDAGDSLTTHAFFEGAVTDFNRDGKTDLALWSTHSFRVLINQGNATFERSAPTLPEPVISLFGFRGAVADLDDDGFDDVMTVDQQGHLRAFANHSGAFREVSLTLPQGFAGSYLAFGPWDKATHPLAVQPDGRMVVLEREPTALRGDLRLSW